MKLFEQRDPFNYVSTLSLEECKARLQSLNWNSRWIKPQPTVKLIDSDMYELSTPYIKANIALKVGADGKTRISGKFWFQPTLILISCVSIAFFILMALIAGNIIGAIATILVGSFMAGVYLEQYEQVKNRLNDLLVDTLDLTYAHD